MDVKVAEVLMKLDGYKVGKDTPKICCWEQGDCDFNLSIVYNPHSKYYCFVCAKHLPQIAGGWQVLEGVQKMTIPSEMVKATLQEILTTQKDATDRCHHCGFYQCHCFENETVDDLANECR